jgi:sugar lactone lactonase YvrE
MNPLRRLCLLSPTCLAGVLFSNLIASDSIEAASTTLTGGYSTASLTATVIGNLNQKAAVTGYVTSGVGFPAQGLGTTSAPMSVTFTFTKAVTLGSISVVTQGAPALDFAPASGSGGTCSAGTKYGAGTSCTVDVTFSPKSVGLRMGAVLLYDNASPASLVATNFVSGTGTGAVLDVSPSAKPVSVGNGLNYPLGSAIDAAGNVYIADFGNNRVVKIPANGAPQTTVGSGFDEPISVAVDGAGNIFVTHNGNTTSVAMIPAGGGAQTTIGAGFQSPSFVSVDGAGNLYVSDNLTVWKWPQDGGKPTTIFSGVSFPGQATLDSAGNIYFSLAILSQVVEILAADGSQKQVGSGLRFPEGVAVDPAGNVYIADGGNNRVVVVSPDGATQSTLMSGLNQPYGLALDGAVNLYIADSLNGRVIELFRTSPSLVDLGTSTVGSAPATATLSLSNIGNQALTLTSTIEPDQFTEANTCSSVAVSANCQFILTFTPTTGSASPGTVQTGTLTLTGNSAGLPQNIDLSGTAIANPIAPILTPTLSQSQITAAQPLTISVNVSGGTSKAIPTGSVSVACGSYTSPAVSLGNGNASVNIPAGSLPVGTDTLTFSYAPDSNASYIYTSALATASVIVTAVTPASFTADGTPVTLTAGATTGNVSTVTVTPSGGFTGTVTLTAAVTSGPAGAQDPPTFSFGPTNTVNISGSSAATATLTIATTAATIGSLSYPARPSDRWELSTAIVLACLLINCIPARSRRWPGMLAIAILFAGVAGGIVACGGSSSKKSIPGTTPGAYTVMLTGTSGMTVASGKITVTVN